MLTPFSAALGQLGLDYGQAAKLLKLSRSTIQKKCCLGQNGLPVLPMTASDARILAGLYQRIRLGDVEGLPQSVQNAARALRILRGVEVPPEKITGRPPKPKAPTPPPPARTSMFAVSPESRALLEDLMASITEDAEDGKGA